MDDLCVEILAPPARDEATRFVLSWSVDDCYERFGTLGDAGPRWLIDELHAGRPALIGRLRGRIVAILDHSVAEDVLHFGIVVAGQYRRRTIGRRLVERLLTEKTAGTNVVAECRFGNAAAVALLRRCGFVRQSVAAGEVSWRHA